MLPKKRCFKHDNILAIISFAILGSISFAQTVYFIAKNTTFLEVEGVLSCLIVVSHQTLYLTLAVYYVSPRVYCTVN